MKTDLWMPTVDVDIFLMECWKLTNLKKIDMRSCMSDWKFFKNAEENNPDMEFLIDDDPLFFHLITI